MDLRWIAPALLLLLAQCASAATSSAYEDAFELKWEADVKGVVLSVEVVDAAGGMNGFVIADSLYTTSYGKSGTIYALDLDGKQKWRFFAGLLENSHTTPKGYTIVGAGPSAEFVNRDGKAVWKRSTRSSPLYKIFSQSVYASDVNGDGFDDALIATNLGRTGSFLEVRSHAGDRMFREAFKSLQFPLTLYTADLNGDGEHEILVGTLIYSPNTLAGTYQEAPTKPTTFKVYDLDGTLKWTDNIESAVTAITACDMDKDDAVEVLVGSLNKVTAYTPLGQRLWDADVAGQVNDLSCADMDEDGILDVAVAAAKTYVLKLGGEPIWSYSTGKARAVEILDLGQDGKPEVIVASSYLRVIDGTGRVLYRSGKLGSINSMATGDVNGDGYVEIALGSDDHMVRLFDTRSYSEEMTADGYFKRAEEEYTKKNYNRTAYYAELAGEIYEGLGLNSEAVRANDLAEKAVTYSEGDRLLNISNAYFASQDYEEAAEYADKAMEEYRKLSDLRKLGEANELKKKAQLIPNAGKNIELAAEYLGQKRYVNASDYALRARSAYSFLGDAAQEERANEIYETANLYVEFQAQLDRAYNHSLYNNFGNATHHLGLAKLAMDTLNDTGLRPRYDNMSSIVYAVKRDEEVLMWGGLSVVTLLVLAIFSAVALAGVYFFQKGGMAAVAETLEDYGLWFTHLGIWVKDSVSARPRREGLREVEGKRSGLRGLKPGKGESLGGHHEPKLRDI